MDPGILHVDERLVVVDKPSGLLSVPGRGADKQDSVVARLRDLFGELLVAHRLDRDTSGVMVLARDAETLRKLGRQFQYRRVDKVYVAIVRGSLPCEQGRIALPLAKDFYNPPRYRVDYRRGRTAVTDYRVLVRDPSSTRVELRPLTGRSHQLRVHLAAIGHPIAGDPLYGPADPVWPAADRLCLHAASIALDHPDDGRRVVFQSPVPF